MTDSDCESVRVAAMAIADGEESLLDEKKIESHLLECGACREEIQQLRGTDELFRLQRRLVPEANLWPMVNERIQARSPSAESFRWRMLLLFGVPLFGYKFLMLIVQAPPSLWSKLVPLILMIAIFTYLKTNPFKINSELTLKGEWPS